MNSQKESKSKMKPSMSLVGIKFAQFKGKQKSKQPKKIEQIQTRKLKFVCVCFFKVHQKVYINQYRR